MAEKIREVDITAVVTATFPANLPANQKVAANIQLDPSMAAAAVLPVPSDEAWVVEDIYVTASQTPNAILEFKKNLTQVMHRTGAINGYVVTNPARPVTMPFIYEGSALITVEAQNLEAVGASPATITVFVKIKKFTPH